MAEGSHPHDRWLADRTRKIESSGIRKVFELARSLKDPVNLSIGQPHFDVPEPIKAAAHAAIEGGQAPGHLPALVEAIRPAVEQARKLSGDLSDNAIRLNVEMVVDQLRASEPVLAEAVAAGKLRIVVAVYSLATGSVTWLPEKAP